ncbi:MAG: TATA-box-binding protein [Candidatus Aenigmarchaeota archaeon]|nr:TATA-box-binding protein [Candidatus Aenigmarchaeota archaeon]MCX8191038.1 TATA-box-binding protein [Candidatus Aenigmarchaeota archaeon]MDW8160306.1 TATA-box-binding protein [Candidatus Aenigmarchaeota archaeon]
MQDFQIKVENIVASISLGVKVPLKKLLDEDTEYEPEQFPGAVYRLKEPKTAALIFSSGKIVCTGSRNRAELNRSVEQILKKLRKIGVKVPKNYKVEIQNIVASAKLGESLNLDKIAFGLENTEYEPEQFPGVVYRIEDPKVAFLFFSSGKVVCTGARKVEDINRAVEIAYKKLKEIKAIE